MRSFLIGLAVACGGPSHIEVQTLPMTIRAKHVAPAPAPLDAIATLAQTPVTAATIVPGPAQLVLGGPMLQAQDSASPLDVDVLEEHGNDVRVGVRLSQARFALWTPRSRMLLALAREIQLAQIGRVPSFGADAIEVVLHAGALVHRLARKGDQTQVRFVGGVDADGWVANDALAERHPAGPVRHRTIPLGGRWQMVTPGTVIRSEPKWTGTQLAVIDQAAFVTSVQTLDDPWLEVVYDDGEIRVHGYLSKQDPPARTHGAPPAAPLTPLAPTATAPDRTCLYVEGEAIGFIIGDQPVVLEPAARAGWSRLTIDTPWGPIAFDARGNAAAELERCGH